MEKVVPSGVDSKDIQLMFDVMNVAKQLQDELNRVTGIVRQPGSVSTAVAMRHRLSSLGGHRKHIAEVSDRLSYLLMICKERGKS